MAKDSTQGPKKGGKVKGTGTTVAEDDTAKEAAAKSKDFLESIDKEIAELQAKKDKALKSQSSVAVTKGKRKVKSIYATIPPKLSEVSSDSEVADNEEESSDDGEIPGTN